MSKEDIKKFITVYGPIENIQIETDMLDMDLDLYISCASGKVIIKEKAFMGYGVKLLAGSHDYQKVGDERINWQREGFDILIERGVWIASGAIIIGPCRIGENSVIGAGSVVTQDVPSHELWLGNPAHFIKKIALNKTL